MERSDDIRDLPALKVSVEDQVYSALDQGIVTGHPARFPAQYRSSGAALARTQLTWAYRLVTTEINSPISIRPQIAIHRPPAFQGSSAPEKPRRLLMHLPDGRMTPTIFEGRAS